MKRFLTTTMYMPLSFEDGKGFQKITKGEGKIKEIKQFKTRKAVEAFCKKHKYVYVEQKFIFYR